MWYTVDSIAVKRFTDSSWDIHKIHKKTFLHGFIPRPSPSSSFDHVLYCTVLYCTVLYCIVLYCTVLYCTALYCNVMYCTVLYCTVLYCTVLYCTVLHCTVLYCIVNTIGRENIICEINIATLRAKI